MLLGTLCFFFFPSKQQAFLASTSAQSAWPLIVPRFTNTNHRQYPPLGELEGNFRRNGIQIGNQPSLSSNGLSIYLYFMPFF